MAPVLGALAFAAFPAVASAATPATSCTVVPPATPSSPCYTAPPAIVAPAGAPSQEVTSPEEGRSIQATPGTWTPPQTSFTYQWTHDCNPATNTPGTSIGVISTTYKIANSDIGHTLCIVVTTSGVQAISSPTGVVAAGSPIDRQAPTISGPAQAGQTLTVTSPGTWDGTQPINFSYTWKRCDSAGANCGLPLSGATGSTYTLQGNDVGHTIRGYVTANNGVNPQSWDPPTTIGSAQSAVVTPGNTAAPTISGTAQQGKTLTVGHGSWSPSNATTSDQWQRCDASGSNCSAIGGATSPNYTLTSSDVGHTLRVQETATANGVTSSPATSGASGVVQGASSPQVITPPPPSGNPGHNSGPGSNNNNNNTSSTVNSGQIRALLVRSLAPQGKGARIRQLLKHGGYVFSFKAPSSGRLVISWYRLKGGRRILVAIATFTFHKSGTASVKLVLTGKGRRLLRGARKMKLISIGDFTPAGQGTTSAIKNITLKA
jgi:hypothetical protein